MKRLFLITCLAVSPLLAAEPSELPERIEFNRHVRPILADNCFHCHGNDPKHREAKLRLDVREEALKSEAFVPGMPGESPLINRILSTDDDERMPPPDSHKQLNESLSQWHWKAVVAGLPRGNK